MKRTRKNEMKGIILAKPYRLNPVVMRWVSAFASCAIAGNELGREMMDLWNGNKRDEFVRRLERDFQDELLERWNEENQQETTSKE